MNIGLKFVNNVAVCLLDANPFVITNVGLKHYLCLAFSVMSSVRDYTLKFITITNQ